MTPDPYARAGERGWRLIDAATLTRDVDDEADVIVIGSGAGGGISAELLARAGLKVIVVEEGPLRSSRDFRGREAEAYPALYQESAARKTADQAINILQGRCVGGSTTVNWTSSFRTPATTLLHWQRAHGLADYNATALQPWFAAVERRLGIAPWELAPNRNNAVLGQGSRALGWEVGVIRRNVRGCANLGSCGMGCPVNAKQSMLVTTLPVALDHGAVLYSRLRAERLRITDGRVHGLDALALGADGLRPSGHRVKLRARHVVLAAGAIGSPALLLRSGAPDPSGLLGARTFLHPTVVSAAVMPEPVHGHSGAPQSLYSDHFLHTQPVDGPVGYKLESAPLHPVLTATTLQGLGADHAALMRQYPHTQVVLALLRDGFHPDSPGGCVRLRDDGSPLLDYALGDYLFEGMRRALLSMAELQFAAGARQVMAVHEEARPWDSWARARAAIAALPMRAHALRVVSAHVMGGCAMGSDTANSVTDAQGRPHALEGLTVADGSLLPTSVGANPQETLYAISARLASALAETLTRRPAPPLA